ncbi:MAG: hypothetical protein AAFO02_23860 [Bacteroidota bacterium]
MNKLALHFFDNVYDLALQDEAFIENGGHKFLYEYRDTPYHASFVEFSIDDTHLMSRFWEGEHRKFLSFFRGLLGYVSKVYDELIISYLLQQEISRDAILRAFAKHPHAYEEASVDDLLRLFGGKELLIYGCPVCGYDYSCGGIKLRVEADQHAYYWYISPEHEYRFAKQQYKDALQQYLKRIRNNDLELDTSMNLYQFYHRLSKHT